MFRRGLGLNMLAALTLLLLSIGVDLYAVLAEHSALNCARPAFTPIGPRRYPPAYWGSPATRTNSRAVTRPSAAT